MSREGISFSSKQETEPTPEMSPEDFEAMIGQIPALKEMLEERLTELKTLEEESKGNEERIQELRIEINELQAEIAAREEVT